MLLGTALAQQTPAATNPQPAPSCYGANGLRLPELFRPLRLPKEKLSYALGMSMGKNLHRDGIDIDPNLLSAGHEGRTVWRPDC